MMKISTAATRLYAMPTFIRGMARVLDIGSTITVYNESPDGKTADSRALHDDWKQVGSEIRAVLENYDYAK